MNYIMIYLGSVFISSVSQILLKSSANKKYDSKIKEYLNWKVMIAYCMFFGSSLATILAYKGVPLSLGPVIESVAYVFVAVLGYFILKEKPSKKKMFGLALIIIGVIVSSLNF